MKVTEILTESLSRVAYHYTGLPAARKILKSGQFELSSVMGSIEQQYAPKGMPFFLSTTRTRTGGYHDYIGAGAVMFVLDGNWFNQHYVSRPVDYWENRDPAKAYHRKHEAEDRVFSRDSTIPIGGVSAVHIYLSNDLEPDSTLPADARQAMLAAKVAGIPAYLYDNEAAWRALDTRKSIPVSNKLRGAERGSGYQSTHPGYLAPWIELIGAKNKSQLSKKANEIRYSLQYSYDTEQAASGLGNDMSNARKPNSGIDRENAVKIINFMRQNRLEKLSDLVKYLQSKWKETK